MVMISHILGLTTSDICEAMQTIHSGNKYVYVDIGYGPLRLVDTIKSSEINGEQVVVLRALL